ncbi:MAG: pyrroline-5-carboxylate reductase [Lentisphaerae bacterium]|nr:pyrroline-5-carboxylate reductase [Lentisphaerota bacterium]
MKKLFFIGAGKMATAIAGGITASGKFQASELGACDPDIRAAAAFEEATGIKVYSSGEGIKESSALLLAVKPQVIHSLAAQKDLMKDKLIISIAAGISIAQLAEITGSNRIIRVMPNTPALVGKGASGYSCSEMISPEEENFAKEILSAVGVAFKFAESSLDAVTALSGSGPAYVFEFIQALADGGVAEGLPRDTAQILAAQTLIGAAEMVLKTQEHPCSLKDKVTSPAGTTSRALEVLADRGFAGTVIKAVRAAAERSRELGTKTK